ncbi:DUF3231 family protein [Tautonia sociabilis]|nr:DUF3231 family protein [Tautonia sociabilis]
MEHAIEIGKPEGRTQFSGYAERLYEERRDERSSLSSSEFTMVMEGFLHEWACIGQCNLYIQAAEDPEVKEAVLTYRHDVCEPNLTEMKAILDGPGYMEPQPYNAETEHKSLEELGTLPNAAMSNAEIIVQMVFGTRGFMNHWTQGAGASMRTDIRDAFVRNWHRANRWNVAFYSLAVKKGFMMPLPTMDAKGLMRTTVMGG